MKKLLFYLDSFSFKLKLLCFVALSTLFFGILLYRLILVQNCPPQEFDSHILLAVDMEKNGVIVVPHFLFHMLTITFHWFINLFFSYETSFTRYGKTIYFDWGVSAFLVTLMFYVILELVLFLFFKKILYRFGSKAEFISFVISFSLTIIYPIFALKYVDGMCYHGYITPSTIYVIPTQSLLKVPSLALFLLTAELFNNNGKIESKKIFFIFLLSILSGLAKPNFILIMIPALLIVCSICVYKKINFNAFGVIVGLISCALVLSWQYLFKFINLNNNIYNSSIALTTPFEVVSHYSDFIFLKIILSIAFPLYVTIAFFKDTKKDFLLMYGWTLFLVGIIFASFFSETGVAKFAYNFGWCAQIGCFMLFVSATAMFFSKSIFFYSNSQMKLRFAYILFSSHVFFGLVYYVRQFYKSYL